MRTVRISDISHRYHSGPLIRLFVRFFFEESKEYHNTEIVADRCHASLRIHGNHFKCYKKCFLTCKYVVLLQL